MYLPEDIDDILTSGREGEALEFKSVQNNFSDKDRSDYCAAIANMGGGKLMLGISDDKRVVGTTVYNGTLNKIPNEVYKQIGITVSVEEVLHILGRVVVFDIPSRPVGQRVRSCGDYTYPVRRGESLGEMDDAMTRKILNEVEPDFSSSVVASLSLDDLDEKAIENFRVRRVEKTGNQGILTQPLAHLLSDSELLRNETPTYAYENKPGVYMRLKGFSREEKKAMIMKYIAERGGATRQEFIQGFSELKPSDISNLLQELKKEEKIIRNGSFRYGKWVKIEN